MRVQHFEKGLHYTDRDLILLAKKIGRLATYCKRLKDESSSIRVEAERRPTKKEQDQVKVMLTLELPQATLRAESRRPRALSALDRCIDKLKGQVDRYKEKKSVRWKRSHALRGQR